MDCVCLSQPLVDLFVYLRLGLRLYVVNCMICNALEPGNSCCSSQRSANDILFMIRFVVFT